MQEVKALGTRLIDASRWLSRLLLAGLLLGALVGARAAEDPPGRVGRVAELDGSGWMRRGGVGEWFGLQRNQPVTTGDWLSTDAGGRAMLQIGSTVLRLEAGTMLQVRRLDDQRIDLWLQAGGASVRLRAPEVIRELSLSWAQGSLQPTSTGAYLVRQGDDGSSLSVLAGEARFNSSARSFNLRAGQSVELAQQPGSRLLDITWTDVPEDEFVAWVRDEDLRADWARDNPPVPVEMTGSDDLDRYGRWEQSPEYGTVWQPLIVSAGWAPYRYGHWAWVAPWGWTWIDDAPWGFAPFHYGRWVYWGTRWVWVPGNYVRRPVYAPALVGWVGGPGWSVTVNTGAPTVGWVPLAPREVYVPVYGYSPLYYQRINVGQPLPPQRHPLPGARPPIDLRNRWAPGGYTAVPTPVIQAQQPVWRALRPQEPEAAGRGALVPMQPPPRPSQPAPVPGRNPGHGSSPNLPPNWKPVPWPGGGPSPSGGSGERTPPVRKPLPMPLTPSVPAQQPAWPSGAPIHDRPAAPQPAAPGLRFHEVPREDAVRPAPRPTVPAPSVAPSPRPEQPAWPSAVNRPGGPSGERSRPGQDLEEVRQPQPQPVLRPPQPVRPVPVPAAQPPARSPAPAYQPVPVRPVTPANNGVNRDAHGGKAPGRGDEDKPRDAPQR